VPAAVRVTVSGGFRRGGKTLLCRRRDRMSPGKVTSRGGGSRPLTRRRGSMIDSAWPSGEQREREARRARDSRFLGRSPLTSKKKGCVTEKGRGPLS